MAAAEDTLWATPIPKPQDAEDKPAASWHGSETPAGSMAKEGDFPAYVTPKIVDMQGCIPVSDLKIDDKPFATTSSFGDVYKGTWHGTLVAIKRLKTKPDDSEEAKKAKKAEEDKKAKKAKDIFDKEIKSMLAMAHPYVCQCLGFTKEPLSLVMVYYPLTLEAFVSSPAPPPKSHCFRIACQISQALCFLHGYNMIHGDLKPDNVFIDNDGNAILGDFGLLRYMPRPTTIDEETAKKLEGNCLYKAPELLFGGNVYPGKAETYSLGLLLYWMMAIRTWISPFPELGSEEQFYQRIKCKPMFPEAPKGMSEDMLNFINSCCEYNPDDRPDDKEVQEKLQQLAVKECLKSVAAQKTWKACTRNGFRETLLLPVLASMWKTEINANVGGRMNDEQLEELARELQEMVMKVLPSAQQGRLTIEDFDNLSMWFLHFWCTKKGVDEMREVVNSEWFANSELVSMHRLLCESAPMFVVRPSLTNPPEYPFTIKVATEAPVYIQRVSEGPNKKTVYQCQKLGSLRYQSVLALVDDLIKLGYQPAPPEKAIPY